MQNVLYGVTVSIIIAEISVSRKLQDNYFFLLIETFLVKLVEIKVGLHIFLRIQNSKRVERNRTKVKYKKHSSSNATNTHELDKYIYVFV